MLHSAAITEICDPLASKNAFNKLKTTKFTKHQHFSEKRMKLRQKSQTAKKTEGLSSVMDKILISHTGPKNNQKRSP